jgi:hypothetical protein
MKLSAKLPPDDEAANLMRAGKHLQPTGVRTLLGSGRWHGRDDSQKGGRVATPYQRRQRVISMGNGYVAAWPHVAVAYGGGSG